MASNEPFGRQPKHVKVAFEGHPMDTEWYLNKFINYLQNTTYDLATRTGPTTFTISPRAANE